MKFPEEFDEYLILDIVLVFLMLNYNMPLATLYVAIVIISSLAYLVPVYSNLFNWIPFARKDSNKLFSVAIGIGFAFAFIYFYNYIQELPDLGTVFATTAFGDNIWVGKIVYGVLIALIETRFFFRDIMQWGAWKMGYGIPDSPFSKNGLSLMMIFGGLFTVFHLTAKGVTNNIDLMATFVFGALSIGMIIEFKQLIEAVVMHITVNSKGVGVFDIFTANPVIDPVYIIIAIIVGVWFITQKTKIRIPFISS